MTEANRRLLQALPSDCSLWNTSLVHNNRAQKRSTFTIRCFPIFSTMSFKTTMTKKPSSTTWSIRIYMITNFASKTFWVRILGQANTASKCFLPETQSLSSIWALLLAPSTPASLIVSVCGCSAVPTTWALLNLLPPIPNRKWLHVLCACLPLLPGQKHSLE